MNVGQVFKRTAERTPNRVALVDRTADVKYTYQEWYEQAIRVAAALQAHSIEPGDRVGIAMRNRVEQSTIYCATQLLGAVFVPYNFRVSGDELTHLVDNSNPELVFFSADVSEAMAAASSQFESTPQLVSVDRNQSGTTSYETFLSKGESGSFSPTVVDSDELSSILHTAGTTGKPKGVPRSHRNTYAAAIAHALQTGWSQGESTLGLMSLSHTMGIHALSAILILNGTWVIQREFSAEATVDLIESENVTSLYLVPTVFHDLIEAEAVESSDLSSVRHISYAGANMSSKSVRTIEAFFDPETFVNHYGSTEVYTHAVCDNMSKKPSCVGRAGINTAIRVVEPSEFDGLDPSAIVPNGELGEIIVDATSPEAFSGYLSDSAADRSLTDGWFFTGDLGYRDEDGDLYFVGRVDDMIISGGENIYPVEVEAVLESHESVAEAAVVGRPSERWNQTVAAFVTLAEPPTNVDFAAAAREFDRRCRESDELADFKRPRKYFFIDEFTKSNVGKILRRELQRPDLTIDVYADVEV